MQIHTVKYVYNIYLYIHIHIQIHVYIYICICIYIYKHPGVDRILRFDNITYMFEHSIFYRLGYRYVSHMLRTDSIHGAYRLCKQIFI